ncbi:hypothetical protein HMPREF1982_03528 [Clostridiales bacterium oral taxon 876 str. F0540]|nr:hypothetical protein HMPREF1982_03528 [Clostridiales bacterium oral taxon 876 str. F0540]
MIDKYLISTCLFIIDEFNDRFKGISKEKTKEIADTEFTEADLVVRLGYPFKQMANFNMQGTDRDIVVKQKDFIIEVKYLRNFNSYSESSKKKNKTYRSNKTIWEDAFEKDYSWLCNEIKNGKKGNRAFVIGWFNAVNSFSELMQLGESRGCMPEINKERIQLFPFLKYNPQTNKTKDITYAYNRDFKEYSIHIEGHNYEVNCMFLGNSEDIFHFAIYF